jgi:hypothetical protein
VCVWVGGGRWPKMMWSVFAKGDSGLSGCVHSTQE